MGLSYAAKKYGQSKAAKEICLSKGALDGLNHTAKKYGQSKGHEMGLNHTVEKYAWVWPK